MKISRSTLVAAVLGGCALGLTGCLGIGDGVARNPARTAENYMHAMADGDDQKVCALVVPDQDSGPLEKDTAQWTQCLAGIDEDFAANGTELSKYADAKVRSATINGNTATVSKDQVSGVLDPDFEVTLIKYDGRWYVSGTD